MSAPRLDLRLPEKLTPLLLPKRFKIPYGGRGSAKSHTVAQVLLMLGTRRRLRILCVREVQKTLKDSSMQVLTDYIERLGLGAYYEPFKNEIRGWNGTTFGFTGLKDHTAESLKSHEGVDIAWCEEANKITENSWNVLIPTIRKDDGGPFDRGSEIWATFNPDQATDYVYKRFITDGDPDAVVIKMNWRDNPWFRRGSIMDKERLRMKALNQDLYEHIWEGKCRSLAGLIFKRRWFKLYKSLPQYLNRYMASDYAGGPDPDNPEREPDFAEHGTGGLDHTGDLYLADWWRDQCDPEVAITAAIAMIKRNKPLKWFEEKGVLLRAMDASIRKRLRENKDAKGKPDPIYIVREPLASTGNKADRAMGFAARAAAGTVWVPDNAWGEHLINELCAFTGEEGKVDNGVDVCSLLARGLDQMHNANPPEPPKPPSWKDELLERMGTTRNPATA